MKNKKSETSDDEDIWWSTFMTACGQAGGFEQEGYWEASNQFEDWINTIMQSSDLR